MQRSDETLIDRVDEDIDLAPVAPARRLWLEAVSGPGEGARLRLFKSVTSVGRSENNDLTLDDHRASSFHLAIYHLANGQLRLKDLGSTNGTLLNGMAVREFGLRVGDELRVGRTIVRLRERTERD